jgi:hypothetical protein
MKEKNLGIWVYACFSFTIFALLGSPAVIVAEDLIVDGITLVLHGEVEYDNVFIMNGGVLYVTPFDGTGDTGMLSIKAGSIFVDATSWINADGAGYRGIQNGNGEGPGGGEGGATVWDGGGGGAYGGFGGNGSRDLRPMVDGDGGTPYGTADSMCIMMGSAGGAAGFLDNLDGGFGGNGGGAISLQANTVEILGAITANGNDGLIYLGDSSGGGAGGGILLMGRHVKIADGLLRAEGGNGGTACGYPSQCGVDDGGGGGSGGRIKIFYQTLDDVSAEDVSTAGGNGAYLGTDGEPGSYYTEKMIMDATVDIDPDTLNLKSKGNFITAYIELPGDYDPSNILLSTLMLNDSVPAELHPADVGDYDSDNIPDLMVKFPRSEVQAILGVGLQVEVTVSGEYSDGTLFSGTDKIRVIERGKK